MITPSSPELLVTVNKIFAVKSQTTRQGRLITTVFSDHLYTLPDMFLHGKKTNIFETTQM